MATNYKINAVILCGGEGTRLKEIIGDRPKCMADINGVSFLTFLFNQLKQSNIVDKFILAVGNKKKEIVTYIHDHLGKLLPDPTKELPIPTTCFGIDLIFSEEKELQGTLIGLLSTLPHIDSEVVLVINGDTYCPNFDFKDFLSHHGNLDISVAKFNKVDSGIWLIKTSFLSNIVQANVMGWNREYLTILSDVKVGYYPMRNNFIDIGTPEGYEKMKEMYK